MFSGFLSHCQKSCGEVNVISRVCPSVSHYAHEGVPTVQGPSPAPLPRTMPKPVADPEFLRGGDADSLIGVHQCIISHFSFSENCMK